MPIVVTVIVCLSIQSQAYHGVPTVLLERFSVVLSLVYQHMALKECRLSDKSLFRSRMLMFRKTMRLSQAKT